MTNKNKKIYNNLSYLAKQDKIPTQDRIKILSAMSRIEKGWSPTKTQEETYNKNSEIIDKMERREIHKRLMYEKRKYSNNYQKELNFVNELWKKGISRTNGAIDQLYGKGDNWKNKYYRLSNEELLKLIDKFKSLNQNVNSNKKRKADFISTSLAILIDSIGNKHITKEEFKQEVEALKKRGKSLGLTSKEIDTIIENVYEDKGYKD